MRPHVLKVLAVLALASCSLTAMAEAQGRMTVGAMLWSHGTNLKVERATDFDGSNMTAEQRAKDWDVLGSGVGVRLSYDFPRLVTVFGEAGTSQATVRDKAIADPGRRVASRGMNNGGYLGLGAQVGGTLGTTGNAFWTVAGSVGVLSAGLEQDINTSWDYDETKSAVDGKVGTWFRQVGLYGGLRIVHSNADLRETDLGNLPGQQVRTTELGRDGAVDLLVGAQTKGPGIAGFTEIGMVGTFSATAGLNLRF